MNQGDIPNIMGGGGGGKLIHFPPHALYALAWYYSLDEVLSTIELERSCSEPFRVSECDSNN